MKDKSELSFWSIVLLGINGIIGSGIFLLPGVLYAKTGVWSAAAILLSGLSTLLIALNYATMASKIDEDGGAFSYATHAFGRFIGFQTGWFAWLLGVITVSGEIAAFLTILRELVPAVKQTLVYDSVALIIVLVLLAVNLSGQTIIKFMDNLSSFIKVALLLVFILAGGIAMMHMGVDMTAHQSVKVADFRDQFSTTFYMFTGFSFLPIAAKRMRNPEKNLPRALIIVILVVIAVYVGTQLTLVLLLGSSLSGNTMPVAEGLAKVVGPLGRYVVMSGIMVSTIGVAIAVTFDTNTGFASLATDSKLLPDVVGKANKAGTPILSVILTLIFAAILIMSGSYLFLVNLIVLSSFIQYIATIASYIKLRKDKSLPVGFRLPLGLTIPIVSLVIILYLLLNFQVTSLLLALGFAILGVVVYKLNQNYQARQPK